MERKWLALVTAVIIGIHGGHGFAVENSIDSTDNVEEKRGEPYKIQVGDTLEIITWKEPDFTRNMAVRIDGRISFPLIDEIDVEGKTALDVKAEIEKRLRSYIEHPIVTVIIKIKDPIPPRFFILGEVNKTGVYEIIGNLTLLQAFATAGGFTKWASKKEIILIRKENDKTKLMRLNYRKIIKGRDLEQNVMILDDDTIIVP